MIMISCIDQIMISCIDQIMIALTRLHIDMMDCTMTVNDSELMPILPEIM